MAYVCMTRYNSELVSRHKQICFCNLSVDLLLPKIRYFLLISGFRAVPNLDVFFRPCHGARNGLPQFLNHSVHPTNYDIISMFYQFW